MAPRSACPTPARRHLIQALCIGLLAWAAGSALAAKPHEHGAAQVDLGIEPNRLVLSLDIPLEALVGFERAPRDDAERQRVEASLARLRDAGALFTIDSAAGCAPKRVVITAPVLGLNGSGGSGNAGAAAPAPKGEHADLEASYEFDCKDGFKAGFIELGLFQAFPRLQRIEVQAVTRKGQLKASLRRPASRVTLAR